MNNEKLIVTLVTAPDQTIAKKLAYALLESRLCACVNIIPSIQSLYWWQGSIEEAEEYLLLAKSRSSETKNIKDLISKEHPYDTPEVISFEADAVADKYLSWVINETRR